MYKDFQPDLPSVLKHVLERLRIDSSFTPEMSRRYKQSYVPRYPGIERGLHRARVKVEFAKQHWPKTIRWRASYLEGLLDRVAKPNRTGSVTLVPPSGARCGTAGVRGRDEVRVGRIRDGE